jgi:hypothetical protein
MNCSVIFASLFLLAACGGAPCDDAKCLAGQTCDTKTGLCSSSSDGQPKNGSRLHVRVFKGDDGSQLPAGFFDTARNEECGAQLADDGKLRCLPAATVIQNFYADASCTTALFNLPTASCSTPDYVFTPATSCGVGGALQKLSAIATPAMVYESAGSCMPRATVPPGQWLQGSAVPASAFEPLTLE